MKSIPQSVFTSTAVMSPSKLNLTIFGLLCLPLQASISPRVQNYTITAIEYLSQHQPGRFDCVFFDAGSDGTYFDPDFQKLIGSPWLHHVVKYVINNSSQLGYNAGLPTYPSLVIINAHGHEVDFHVDQLELNPNTRILILFDMDCGGCVRSVVWSLKHFFKATQFTRIVCIESKYMFFVRVGFKAAFGNHSRYLEPGELFKNLLLDMEGRSFNYSGIAPITMAQRNWIKETARYLNATVRYLRAPCDHKLGIVSECFKQFFVLTPVTISLDCNTLSSLPYATHRALFEVIPYANAFAIPTPRSINMLEIFFWPFSPAAWIVLALIVIFLELLSLVNPNLFKNHPTLLIICGFERYNLHRADVKEKLIFLSLIIFFFLITNAYETMIISCMIEKPSIKKIKTVQQLIDSGLPLAARNTVNYGLFRNEKFSGILFNLADKSDNFDGKSTFYGPEDTMRHRVRMPLNYDFERRRPGYYVLDETDGTNVCLYWLPWHDSLMELLGFTERIFFEGGFLYKWVQEESDNIKSKDIRLIRRKGLDFSGVKDTLVFEDMLPAWIVIVVGLIGSLSVFFGELLNKRIVAVVRRLHNR